MGFTQQMRINAQVAAGEASRRRAAAARQPAPDLAASIARLFPTQQETEHYEPTD